MILNRMLLRSTILSIQLSTGGNMPHYEFFCHACKQLFQKTLSPAEYEEGDVVCPHCGSEEVEQRVSAFYPVSWKESA